MLAILMEGVLFVALLVASGALLFFVVTTYTPLGRRWREVSNRKRIERAGENYCSIHGAYNADAVVRLPTGERVCPHCFQESVWQTQ